MIGKVQFNLSGTTYAFEIEEKDDMEVLHKVAVLGNPPNLCHVCKNNKYFRLVSNKDKEGNTYVKVRCTAKGCGAESKLGQYKAGGYFWHDFEQWRKDNNQQASPAANNAPREEEDYADDMPF